VLLMKPVLLCFDQRRAFLPAALPGLAARSECAARDTMRAATELVNPFGAEDDAHAASLSGERWGLALSPAAAAADGVVGLGGVSEVGLPAGLSAAPAAAAAAGACRGDMLLLGRMISVTDAGSWDFSSPPAAAAAAAGAGLLSLAAAAALEAG
jgi:hypothetical protein